MATDSHPKKQNLEITKELKWVVEEEMIRKYFLKNRRMLYIKMHNISWKHTGITSSMEKFSSYQISVTYRI
jgi:hypothetical protein